MVDPGEYVTHFADFTSSDGSPGFREWQKHDESDDDFVARVAWEVASSDGYVHCDRIVRCVMEWATDLEREAAEFGRNKQP